MILEETDKCNDLSANIIIPQGQNILCTFSCADSNGFVEGSYMPIQPPQNAISKRDASEMRHFPFLALYLSMP